MKIYITFGQAHVHQIYGKTFDKDCVVVIEADSENEARTKAIAAFDSEWFTSYTEKPDMNYFPRGLVELTEIDIEACKMMNEIKTFEGEPIKGLALRFDGPPGPNAGRFIELEIDGKSTSIGEWIQQGNDWLLVLGPAYAAAPNMLQKLEWLYHDMGFKAPEQWPSMRDRWLGVIEEAISSAKKDKTEKEKVIEDVKRAEREQRKQREKSE